jgi:GT2 family glycosyltransferase
LELIVVDNNSSDDTKSIVLDFIKQSAATVKYVYEIRPGLSHARNAGIDAASGEIIAFTDDDCFVDPNWLFCIIKEFQTDPTLSGIGGRIELYDSRDKPVTIRTSQIRSVFSSTDDVFGFIQGCNMAFRHEVFDQIGNFDVRFGAGTILKSAEDCDFIYRVYKNGFKMLYSPDACVYHNHGRRTNPQVYDLNRGYTIGKGAFFCKHILNGDVNILKNAYWDISATLRMLYYLFLGTWYFLIVFGRSIIANAWLRMAK